MVCITGVSGAGKTTLVSQHPLRGSKGNGNSGFDKGAFDSIKGLEQIHDIVLVDQSPIGKSLRSNPAPLMSRYSATFEISLPSPGMRRGMASNPATSLLIRKGADAKPVRGQGFKFWTCSS